MRVAIKRTRPYERKAKRLLAERGMKALEDEIAKSPMRWPIIRGTGGVWKIRHALPGKGKSGGVRAGYYFHGKGPTVYMLTVYAKNERDNLSDADKAALKQIVKAIKVAASED